MQLVNPLSGLNNPLPYGSIPELIEAILAVVVILAIPVMVLSIIWSGFCYVTARGNVEKISQATRALTYAIIGSVCILGATAFASILRNVVDSFAT